MKLLRLITSVYWILLTVLLLVPDPGALFGIKRISGDFVSRGIHFSLFFTLGVLVFACRWPIKRTRLMLLLIGYAIVTEAMQWLVPVRTVELIDLLENLSGLALGFGLWWLVHRPDPETVH